MLQFIFGPAASGKTTTMHNMIAQDIAANTQNIVLLVPEQNTFETEKQMLNRFGGGFMSMVEVLSFTRMCESAGQQYGGVAGIKVDDSQRTIIMGRALKKVAGSLEVFRKYISSPTFIKQMTSAISEFKMAGVSSDELMRISNESDNPKFKAKLYDIALVYATYDDLLKGVYIDPLDDLERFLEKALNHKYFSGKTIYIDAFKGFTGLQMKAIKLMVQNAENVIISLCCEGEDKRDGVGVFSNIAQTAERIKGFTDNSQILPPIILEKTYYNAKELTALERILSDGDFYKYDHDAKMINIGELSSPSVEIDYVFKQIHTLVRQNGYKYEDFVIIARNIENYERLINVSSEKFNVPCYMDKRRSLMASPLSKFVISLLKAAKSFDTESIISLLKTDFFGLTDNEISILEEYIFIWGIKSNDWCNEWKMDPAGLANKESRYYTNNDELLKEINQIRVKIISPLFTIKKAFSDGVKAISKAVYDIIMLLKVDQKVKSICDELYDKNQADDADFIMDSWDEVMKRLDSMVRCYGDDAISADEYITMMEISLNSGTIGTIPRMLDEVSCGSADRIRPARPKVVFAVGLNLGEFPAIPSDSGILLRDDRIKLDRLKLEISDRYKKFAVDENFLVYSALCSATDIVYALRHTNSFDGGILQASPIFSKIKTAFEKANLVNGTIGSLPETIEEGFEYFASNRGSDDPVIASLDEFFNSNADFASRIAALNSAIGRTTRRVSKEKMEEFYKKSFKLSPSKAEVYSNCPFSYFCQSVLNIRKPQKAEIDNVQRGLVVHYVLEKTLSKLGKTIANATDDELESLIDKYLNEYLNLIDGIEFLKSERFNYTVNEIGRMLKYLMRHISNEFKNCDFEPNAFELSIDDTAKTNKLPSLKIQFTPTKEAVITGVIDRVDVYKDSNGKEFVRIIDYKTYGKKFLLSDVLYGLNMQMLIYLYALKKIKGTKYTGMESAGIFYMPATRGMETKSSKNGQNAMNGFVLDDADVISAMDRSNSGEYVFKKAAGQRKDNPALTGKDMQILFDYLESKLIKVANEIYSGNFDLAPQKSKDSDPCKYCDFSAVCGIESDFKFSDMEFHYPDEAIEKMKEELGI